MIGKPRNKILSRLAGLAAGDGFGCAELRYYEKISKGRIVRFNQSDEAFGKLSGCQHRGGPWQGEFGFVRPVLAHSAGLTQRNRNPLDFSRPLEIGGANRDRRRNKAVRRYRTYVAGANSFNTGKAMTLLFAICYSLFAMERSSNV